MLEADVSSAQLHVGLHANRRWLGGCWLHGRLAPCENAEGAGNGCDISIDKMCQQGGRVVISAAAYGAAWRSPSMAFCVAVEFHIVFIAPTLFVPGFGWMAGLVTGADLRHGEVLDPVFASMAIAGSILLALAPVVFFFIIS